SDIVRHIRFGRHPNRTTRIVLDLENVSRYSVFTLYNPYRIVIDAERAPGVLVALAVKDAETAGTRPASASAPTSHTASADKSAPTSLGATPGKPDAADVAHASETPSEDKVVAAGKPVAPARNSSGKFSVARQLGLGVSRIVIDAGHGGHDPGASAHGISEAELVLDVALRLETLLLQQAGMEVILTRRKNDYLTLEERTEIANNEAADLFLSIHANASSNAAARGVETYFLNFALNPQAEAVAARENAASGKTMNSLPQILKAITLNNKLNESRDFASSIQRALVRGMRPRNKALRDLGVKQAPFMVLIGAAMPSVLAEISFVTNRPEARLLKTPAYRQRIAESLLAGILRYQDALKKVQTAALQ
ncbi:MAG: N-acetylmuramoyl-L-alanine amidase, partial [Acidobacteria bacterium]